MPTTVAAPFPTDRAPLLHWHWVTACQTMPWKWCVACLWPPTAHSPPPIAHFVYVALHFRALWFLLLLFGNKMYKLLLALQSSCKHQQRLLPPTMRLPVCSRSAAALKHFVVVGCLKCYLSILCVGDFFLRRFCALFLVFYGCLIFPAALLFSNRVCCCCCCTLTITSKSRRHQRLDFFVINIFAWNCYVFNRLPFISVPLLMYVSAGMCVYCNFIERKQF